MHYTAAPVPGGVELAMAAQAEQLRSAGYDVRLLAGRGAAEILPELDSRHPEVEQVTRALARGEVASSFDDLRCRLRERLRVVLEDRQLLIVHNVLTMPFNLPLVAALIDLDRPLLAWTHDVAWTNGQYAAYRHLRWPYQLIGRAQPRVTYVTISRLRQRELAALFELPLAQVPVVPNAVDANAFAGLGPRAFGLLEKAGALQADPLLLVPVRVTPRKRLELALEAAAELRARMPRLRVVVTGPLGPHNPDNRAYAERLLERRAELGLEQVVRFLFELAPPEGPHPVTAEDVAQLYRISDAVLLPSDSEGFGLPLVEAALARVPVVCADLPIFREVAGGGLYTFPVSAGGPQVAAQVLRALNQRATRQRRRALQRYSWPEVLERTERVIGQAVGR
jgi:glycosyltransferase involved in cell wall biosynthesis